MPSNSIDGGSIHGGATGLVFNPSFDPRILSRPFGLNYLDPGNKIGFGLRRGNIVAEAVPGQVRYGCNFLYNPTLVAVDHSVDSTVPTPDMLNPNDPTTALVAMQQSVSFNLLFDRTYETWDSKYLHDKRGRYGVFVDILALYRITGIARAYEVGGSDQEAQLSFASRTADKPVGPMTYVPVHVNIGGPLTFYGVIQTMSVQYTHWTQNMVPNRAAVSLGVQLLPDKQFYNPAQSDATEQDSAARTPSPSPSGPMPTPTGSGNYGYGGVGIGNNAGGAPYGGAGYGGR